MQENVVLCKYEYLSMFFDLDKALVTTAPPLSSPYFLRDIKMHISAKTHLLML